MKNNSSKDTQSSTPTWTKLSAQDFNDRIQDPSVFVLDVHTPQDTHIPGTDAFIPDSEVMSRLSELPGKDSPIAVYCRSGNMSTSVAENLAKAGYSKVYELDGGTNSYKMHISEVALTPASHPLGTVIYGDIAAYDITLTNYTSNPLTVTRISTSCGCTSASMGSMQLEPYTSSIIRVSFDPAVHKDDTDLGELTRTIYLETDNPNFSKLEANFSATVIKK